MVPRGSPPAAFEARAKEAEALRARFQSCEEGIALARGIRYVAVRTQVVKSSAELPTALRDVLAKTELGRLTAPEPRRRASKSMRCAASGSPTTRRRKKKFATRCSTRRSRVLSRNILKELRDQAMIEYR